MFFHGYLLFYCHRILIFRYLNIYNHHFLVPITTAMIVIYLVLSMQSAAPANIEVTTYLGCTLWLLLLFCLQFSDAFGSE